MWVARFGTLVPNRDDRRPCESHRVVADDVSMTTLLDPRAADDLPPAPPPPAPPAGRFDGWLLFAVVAAVVALIAAVVGIGLGSRAIDESKDNSGTGAASAATAVPTIHLSEFKIEPAEVDASVGQTLQVMNMGTTAHDLSIEGQNKTTGSIAVGTTGSLDTTGLAAGAYTLFCSIPGHKEAGMKATLKLASASGGAAAAPAAQTMSPEKMDEMMRSVTKSFPAKTAGVGGQALQPKVLADGTKQFELTTKVVQWEVEPGKKVEAWTYNGTVPGPTIKVNPGDKVKFVVHNELPESTAVHWHGILVPNDQDGVPDITQDPIKPGQTYTYSFTAQSTPAVGMYHSHHDAAKQVSNGLAGAFLIGDEPVPAGVSVSQQHVMMLNDSGTIGFSLNGKSFPATAPYIAKLGEWVEVHYMNEGVMAHPMHLHGLTQTVIAKDGFPVPQPYQADTILVGPGERYTVLVHADQPGTWAWHCHILTHAERDTGMFGMVTAMVVS